MQWWCAATTAEWAWNWRPYPGVWVFVLGLLTWYALTLRRSAAPSIRPVAFGVGLTLLWACLDWPLGALGAGYLLSIHTTQYVLITCVAVPLLLVGIPPELRARGRFSRFMAGPAPGLLVYTAVMAVTHVPSVSDALMATQVGSLVVDLAWIGGAIALWWPVLAPEGVVRITPPLRVGYLFLATIPPTIPAAFMVFSDYPLYATYELAPRVAGIAAGSDQQTAGLIMKAGADPLLWIAMAIVFFRWQRAEEASERRARSLSPQEIAS
jgi:cytochrome c oxidase assembly factor CtaG